MKRLTMSSELKEPEHIIQNGTDFGVPCPHGYPYGICKRCPYDILIDKENSKGD